MNQSDVTPSRRQFLKSGLLNPAAFLLPSGLSLAQDVKPPAALSSDLVKEFVVKAHGDFKRTQEMLQEQPGLLNASWDWGGGDFEMGIEGAGHVGNKEIATFLISKGARMTIFVATMLGHLDTVKTILTRYPEMIHARGPHGLTYLHHARKGGAEALAVLEYLQSLGAT